MNHYRGKTVGTKEWIYGYYYEDIEESFIRLKIAINKGVDYVDTYEVEPEGVGQYTGMEIDGVKLYDKMRFNFQNEIFRIEWSENLLCWVSIRDRDNVFFQTLNFIRDLEIEIIQD